MIHALSMRRLPGRRDQRGFTLIELMIVVAIIGILTTVAVGQYQRSIQKAKEAVLKENLWTCRQQINRFFADKGRYPADLQELVEQRYLSQRPLDPITESTETWIEITAEITESDITTEPGIADIKSGADGAGLDGVPYSDW